MSTETYTFDSGQPLTEAYIHRSDPRIVDLYGYHAGVEQDWVKRYSFLKNNTTTRADAVCVANVLQIYNEKMGASEQTLQAIEHLRNGSPVVIGGQQAGLWTGPLLVIHKAVSILGAAKSASEQLGTPVVPVFWIAGEDHDWDEVNHAYVITAEQELRKLQIARGDGARTSVSRTKLEEEQWTTLLSELQQALPHSEFKAQLLHNLGAMASESSSLSDLFARILTHLFGTEGLIVMDADDAEIRTLEAPMFLKLLHRNDELEAAYKASAEHVKRLGYANQADVVDGSANVFLFDQEQADERTLLYKRNGRYEDRRGMKSWTKEEILLLAEEHPQLLSNNVLTRPLMQDYVFPVLAAVLGPGEIAYWALTGQAFERLGMQMPIVVPRMSFTMIEGTVTKFMSKYELSFADVMERFDDRKESWLRSQDHQAIDERFDSVRAAFNEMYDPLIALAADIQTGLAKLGDTNKQKILEQINYMESKTLDAHNQQYEASTRQLDRIKLAIQPNDKPQERVLTMVVYWNRYGDWWLQKLLEVPYSRTGGHEIVYL